MTPEQVAQFDQFVHEWQIALNLGDWRLIRSAKTPRGVCADVQIAAADRVAVYRLGKDFGLESVTDQSLESACVHELLHVLLAGYKILIETRQDPEVIMCEEHRIIHTLERLLVPQ